MRRVALIGGIFASLAASFAVGIGVGLLRGESGAYHRRFLEEQEKVAPVLASDPAFARVEIHEYSGGGCYLMGAVKSREDFRRLKTEVVTRLGEARAEHLLTAVAVEIP